MIVRRQQRQPSRSGYEAAGAKTGVHPSYDDFAAERGADPAEIDKVAGFVQSCGLNLVSTDLGLRTLAVEGSVDAIERAFGIQLERFESQGGDYRSYRGMLSVPDDLADIVQAILGLDDRPVARPRQGAATSLPVSEVVSAYRFPTSATPGQGQVVGIIELGGGFFTSDLTTVGVDPRRVEAVSIDGAANRGGSDSANDEVALDVQVVSLAAPGASVRVYFAPNGDRGAFDAYAAAIHRDSVSIVSTSWGRAEADLSSDYVATLEGLFDDAAYLGTTICAASGDDGSRDQRDGHNVDYPASSPGVLGCGGTTLMLDPGDAILSEVVWGMGSLGATGGGFSNRFARPSWQSDLPPFADELVGRGVPDVASVASGFNVVVDGSLEGVGGTSAAAPLWAALVAVLNERLGRRLGYLNGALYGLAASFPEAFRDITEGNNEVTEAVPPVFAAGPGWDPCTGLGTPNGDAILLGLELTQFHFALHMSGPSYDECGVATAMPGQTVRFEAWVDAERAGSTDPFPALLPAGWATTFNWSLDPGSGGTALTPMDHAWVDIQLPSDGSPVHLTVVATVHAVEGASSHDITLTGHAAYRPEDNVSARFRHFICWMEQQLVIRPPWPIGDPARISGDPSSRRFDRAELERVRTISSQIHDLAGRILDDDGLLLAGSFEVSTEVIGGILSAPAETLQAKPARANEGASG